MSKIIEDYLWGKFIQLHGQAQELGRTSESSVTQGWFAQLSVAKLVVDGEDPAETAAIYQLKLSYFKAPPYIWRSSK